MSQSRKISENWFIEARLTFALAWPLILTNIAQTAMTTTDVLMLGWTGPEALAAGTLGINLFRPLLMIGNGLVIATSALMAVELGRNRFAVRDPRRTVRQGFWSSIVLTLPIWLILWFSEPIFLRLGQEPNLAHLAATYLRALQWGLLPFLFYLVLRSFMSTVERPAWILVVSLGGVALNALLNWVLIFGKLGFPPMGVVGSGLATSIASLLMFLGLALVAVKDRRFRRYQLFGRFWRADWPRFRTLWRIGIPISVTIVLETMVFNATVFLMGVLGLASLAAHSIAIQVASLAFMIPLGLAQAATVRVGRAYGAGDHTGAGIAGWLSLIFGTGFMVLTASAMILAPRMLISAFIDADLPENAGIVALAISFLAVAGIFQVVDSAQVVGAGMLRGLQDTRIPMYYAMFGYWGVGLPIGAGLAFATPLKGLGLWIGLASGLGIVAVLVIWRWTRREEIMKRQGTGL